MPSPLRVGLLLDSPVQPRWVAHLIARLQASSVAQVALVVVRGSDRTAMPPTRAPLPLDAHLLYRLFTRLDDRLFRAEPDAFAPTAVASLLPNGPRQRLQRTGGPEYAEAADWDSVRAAQLDVLIDLGGTRPAPPATLARLGVWSLRHGASLDDHGSPPGFWEVMDGRPVIGSALVAATQAAAGGKVLVQSYACTDRSVRRSKNGYYWKTADFIPRKLAELYERGPGVLAESLGANPVLAESLGANPAPAQSRHSGYPRNLEMAGLMARITARHARSRIDRLVSDQRWCLVLCAEGEPGLATDTCPAPQMRLLAPPGDRFWADPFPVQHGDARLVFFEEMDRRKGKAHIAVLRVGRDGRCGAPATVLERPYHLSYPFVFAWQGGYYMLPETRANRTVEVYRAERFPSDWTLDRVLLDDVNATDATIAPIDGSWWLFVTVAPYGAPATDELYLYCADSPLGPWTPHRRNPVKSDVRSARPAGRIICHDGAYYRPSQDCSGSYGRAIVLHRIVQIDRQRYAEQEVGRIEAGGSAGLAAVHTINGCDGLVCLDGMARRNRLRSLAGWRETKGGLGLRLRSPHLPPGWSGAAPRAFGFVGQAEALLNAAGRGSLNSFVTGGQLGGAGR